jgi:adenine-specific DNA-methyltransferase
MDKLKMHSPDLTQQNIDKLLELFPNCKTEKQDSDGNLSIAVDFDLLKQELSKNIVEGPKERYQLNWPGKKEALLTANAPIAKTLRPCREESVDFDSTENLFIEGDNLDALKLLQDTYLGKVKMIYIDPPYNTGKDFVYADNFSESTEDFLYGSGQKDEEGNQLVANTYSNGRFHSAWLSMIYSRLRLARNLLSDDGVIFISIDDNEVDNLRKVSDEIFGELNFAANFIWNTEGNTDNQYVIKVKHEYILCYYRNAANKEKSIGKVIDPNTPKESNLWKGYADNNINKNNVANPPVTVELPVGFPCTEQELFYPAKILDDDFFRISRAEKLISDSLKEKYGIENMSGLPVKLDDVVVKDYKLAKSCRIYVGMANRDKLEAFIANGLSPVYENGCPIEFYLNSNSAVRYRKKNDAPRNIVSVLRNFGTTEKNKTYLKRMGIAFDYPKPVELLSYLVSLGTTSDSDIILDFFSGSAASAEAIMKINKDNDTSHKFIMVQISESCDETTDAYKSGFKTVAEISKERIRRAGKKITEENPESTNLDTGFRVLKIDSSNMENVYYTPDSVAKDDLFNQVEHIKSDRTSEDLLFQVMLDWGVDLSLPIRKETIEGKEVYFVNDDDLIACFDKDIDEPLIKVLAAKGPLRVVFRDDGFASDSLKINVEQIFKQLAPATDIKVI